MKWFHCKLRIVDAGQVMESTGHIHGESEDDAKRRKVAGLKKAGWFTDELQEFKMDLTYDERLTKIFDEQGKWKDYK